MTTSVGIHGLTCLGEDDYAAVALSIQRNAEAINDALGDLAGQLTGYGNRFVFKQVDANSHTISANSGNTLPDGTPAGALFSGNFGVLPLGWYGADSSMTYAPTGAASTSSYRRGVMLINPTSSEISNIPPRFFQSVTSETGVAPDSLTVNGWWYSDGVTATRIGLYFGHGNVASTMLVSAGTTLTVRYLSSGRVT